MLEDGCWKAREYRVWHHATSAAARPAPANRIGQSPPNKHAICIIFRLIFASLNHMPVNILNFMHFL